MINARPVRAIHHHHYALRRAGKILVHRHKKPVGDWSSPHQAAEWVHCTHRTLTARCGRNPPARSSRHTGGGTTKHTHAAARCHAAKNERQRRRESENPTCKPRCVGPYVYVYVHVYMYICRCTGTACHRNRRTSRKQRPWKQHNTTHINTHDRSTNVAPRTPHGATSAGPWFTGSLPHRPLTTYRTQAPTRHAIPFHRRSFEAGMRSRISSLTPQRRTVPNIFISSELTNLHSSKAPRRQQRQRNRETKSQPNSSRNLPQYREPRAARRTRHA